MSSVLMPLPDRDFDVTEVAVPWRAAHAGRPCGGVLYRTWRHAAAGRPAVARRGVLFGQLGAEPEPCAFIASSSRRLEFRRPLSWDAVDVADYDGLLLPGGHAPGMRQYLGAPRLQAQVAAFFVLGRPVGAICHGVLVAARSRDPATGVSVLHDRTTTCLTKYQERSAYLLTFWKLGRYYRTYPAYVEDEVKAALRDPARQFRRGPMVFTRRDTESDDRPAFVVCDRNYVSARWPGDAYTFARAFARLLAV